MRRILTIVTLAAVAFGVALEGASPDFDAAVRAALVAAVQQRCGVAARVSVTSLTVTATPVSGTLVATPAADARTGRPSLFSLTARTPSGPRRVGSALATMAVEADVLQLRRDVARGEVLRAADFTPVRTTVIGTLLKAFPLHVEAEGARAVRAMSAGMPVVADAIALVPLVRSGQQVRVRVLVDNIEARGVAVAMQNGRAGAVIRIVNPESRRTLVARVIGPGEVEVIHGS